LPGFWKDVVWKTVKGLPGGITSFTGGALQSLPLPYMEEAGDWLKDQGEEYLTTVGYSKDEAEGVVAGEAMFGRVWGEGMQMVAGVGALGKAAKAGKMAKAGLTGAKAAKYAEATSKVVQIAEDVNAFYKENKAIIDYSFKVVTDVAAKATEGKEVSVEMVFETAYERALKELFSKMGEGPEGEYKKAEGDAFKGSVSDRKAGDAAEDKADRHEAHAGKLRDRSAEMRESGQRGHAGPANLAGYMDKQAGIERENAKGLSKASRKKLVAYLLRNTLRRLMVNVIQTMVVEYAAARKRARESGRTVAAEMKSTRKIIERIAVSTIREVVTDLFVNYLFVDLGKMSGSMDVAKESVKLCIDGVTKIVAGLVKQSIAAAT
jgi:urease gamma subunit